MQSKLFLVLKFFLLVLPVALTIGLVNWYIDPGLIFQAHTYEERLADTLLSNKNAIINTNFNDRILERNLVNKLKFQPQTIILGTSRIMQLKGDFFCNDTIFNNAVSTAKLEDLIAIYGLYAKREMHPKRLIINMEPTFFSVSTDPPLWVDLSDEYEYMLNILQIKPANPIWVVKTGWETDKLSNLYSFEYFKASVHRFAHNLKEDSQSDKIVSTQAIYNTGITRLSDGSMTYNAAIRNQSESQVLETAIKTAGKPLGGISNFKPDDYKVQLFEKFIEYLISRHINVVLTITPYHPAIYKELVTNSTYNLVLQNESYIKSFAKSRHISSIGSYNPELTHTTNSDFLDSYHLKPASLYKLLGDISGCNNLKTEF